MVGRPLRLPRFLPKVGASFVARTWPENLDAHGRSKTRFANPHSKMMLSIRRGLPNWTATDTMALPLTMSNSSKVSAFATLT